MLVQVDVAGGTAVQIPGEFPAVQLQLVQHIPLRVLPAEEVAVVAISRDEQFFRFIPCGVLHAEIFRGHHFTIPHDILSTIPAVCLIDWLENCFGIFHIVKVVGVRLYPQ